MQRRSFVEIALAAMVLGDVAVWAAAAEPPGFAEARQFWAALAKGDPKAMKGLYAPQVLLKAGSELLKPQWGLSVRGERGKDAIVPRADLLRAYDKMIAQFGKDAWLGVFNRIQPAKIRIGISSRPDDPFAGVRPGDVLLRVGVGRSDDKLLFALRPDERGQWQVVAEWTDY